MKKEKKLLKIAVVADVLGKENNGTTIAGMNLIRFLKSRGHDVVVVAPDKEKQGEPGFVIMPTIKLGGPINKYIEKNGVVIARVDNKLLKETLADRDVVHSMLPFSLGKATARATKELGIPLTAGFHTQAENITSHFRLMNIGRINRLAYRILNNRLYKYADGIHYPTQFIRDTFEKIVGPTPGYVISNGVHKRFQYLPSLKREKPFGITAKYIILFIGRLSEEKTHHQLLKAVLHSKYKDDIQLVFAGLGPMEKKIVKFGKKLPHPPLIKFFNREEMVTMINNATLYVHASEIEIEAISCLEAISGGLVPVINNSMRSATRYFALDEKNLFENRNSSDLAAKIDYWLSNPGARDLRRKEYLDYTKRFDYDYCMGEMENMLYEVVHNGKKTS